MPPPRPGRPGGGGGGGGRNWQYAVGGCIVLAVFMVSSNHPSPSAIHLHSIHPSGEHELPSKRAVVSMINRGGDGVAGLEEEHQGRFGGSDVHGGGYGGGAGAGAAGGMEEESFPADEDVGELMADQRSLMGKATPSNRGGLMTGGLPTARPDCKKDDCIVPIPEGQYIQAFADPDGGKVPMSDIGLYPQRKLSIKVFVYEEADVRGIVEATTGSKIHLALCSKGMWGTQVILHKFLQKSPIRTRNPFEADYFFVPVYPKCLLDKQGLSEEVVNRMYINIIQQMPFFRRSGGRDHIFVFPSGRGATCFKDWKEHISNSIFISPEGHFTDNYAEHTPYFDSWKDIVVPGRIDERKEGLASAAKPLSQRGTLAIFYGTHQGKYPRVDIMKLAKKYPDRVKASCQRTPRYFEFMGDSKFCFAPRGQSSWTLRFYESFFAGCVPVILADNIELPWSEVIDYSKFTIKWPMTRINDDLVQYLESIPSSRLQQMVEYGRRIRCLFVYHNDVTKCNAFTALLWKLEAKKRVFQQSREVFWLHDGKQVDRRLVPIEKWGRGPFESKRMYWNAPTDKCYPQKCKWGGPNVCRTTDTGLTCKGLKEDVKC